MTSQEAAARAESLIELNRPGEAIELLQRALSEEPHDYRLLCLIAVAELGSGRPNEARSAAHRALATDPTGEWAHRIASLAYTRLAWTLRAVEHGKEAVALAPLLWQTHHTLALALWAGQEHALALEHANKCLELAPNEADAHFIKASCAMAAGDRVTARAEYQRTLALQPNHSGALNDLARLDLRRWNLFRGASRLAASLATNPHSVVARRNVDILARRFLFIFHMAVVVAYLMLGAFAASSSTASTSASVTSGHGQTALVIAAGSSLLLLVSGLITVDRCLPRSLRGYYRRLPRTSPWIGGWLTVDVIALLLVLALAIPASNGTHTALRGTAWLCLILGVIISRRGAHRMRRAAASN